MRTRVAFDADTDVRGDAAPMIGIAQPASGIAAGRGDRARAAGGSGRAAAADPTKVLRIEFYVAETGFDPVKVQDYYSQTVCEAIFESLMTYDYLARPAKLVPRAAEAMPEISDQARTYVFKIRKGIYFAPDPAFKGKPRELTADDYAYTIKRFRDPANKSPYESFLDGVVGLDEVKKDAEKTGKFDYDRKVAGLQVLDRYTLQVRLKETDYNFAHILAMPNTGAWRAR